MPTAEDQEVVLFCDMTALTAEQRQRHQELALLLRPQVAEFKELADGYVAVFQANVDDAIAEFCELEQRCCHFFKLQQTRNGSVSELTVTGPGDIKPFIRAEFGIPDHGALPAG